MKVIIFGSGAETDKLTDKVKVALDELGLTDFIQLENSTDDTLKQDLSIKESPALIIEEESIDFKDMIFEGMIPEDEELKSMFVSIIGGGSGG
jgi:hypothetical protein